MIYFNKKDEIKPNITTTTPIIEYIFFVKDKINDTETTFTINGSHELSSSMLIGKCSDAKIYSKLGAILRVLESKFGYLLIVILPTLILFLYEIYRVIIEIKTPVTVNEE